MEFTSIAFHTASLLLALLAAALLLWVNQERKHNNRLLAFILLLFAAQNLIHILLFSQFILRAPWLLRAFAPTTFLLGPVTFIYFRSILYDEMQFRKYDWLLLIPAILAIINFIPYYTLPEADKIKYLNDHFYTPKPNQDSGRGILPTTLYYIIRACWSAFFLFSSFRLVAQFRKRNTREFIVNNKVLLQWLFTFNGILAMVWLVTLFLIIVPGFSNIQTQVINILFGATIFFICLQLFMRPQILYGVYQPLSKVQLSPAQATFGKLPEDQPAEDGMPNAVTNSINREPALTISPADQLKYKNVLETYFNDNKPYLDTDYSLERLVRDVRIPRYTVSAFINREYGIGFRDFLNRYRVEYFIENLNNPSWNNLTLEAIGAHCGFNSRSTFINNVKKNTGQTPSEYFKTRHQM